MNSLSFTWMIAIPLGASPLVYLAGRAGVKRLSVSACSMLVHILAFVMTLLAWIPYIVAVRNYLSGQSLEYTIEGITLQADAISLLLTGMILFLGIIVVLFSGGVMRGEVGEEKYYAMLLVMMGMMIGMVCATDLFNLWVWFEGMAVSSYLLVTFYREEPASLEAGMKYLVQSATGSVFVLMGIAVVLAYSGSLNLAELIEGLSTWTIQHHSAAMAAAGLFIVGFGVKTALVPLHTWLPDAHSQAPGGISALLSGVVIEVGLIAMMRALGSIGQPQDWRFLLPLFGLVNMFFGNLVALRQSVVKRMLAYSSLSHVGYILLGLGIGLYPLGQDAAQGAMFHLVTHMLMKGLAFLAVSMFIHVIFTLNGRHGPLEIQHLAGAARKYPVAAMCLSIALLGLAGLPPLAGFMSKWQIFVGGFNTLNGYIMAMMIFMALNSVLSLGYYAPLVNVLYREEQSEEILAGHPISWVILLPIILLAFFIVILGLFPVAMDWLTIPAAQVFLGIFGR